MRLIHADDLRATLRAVLLDGAPARAIPDERVVRQTIALLSALTKRERNEPTLLFSSRSRWRRAVPGGRCGLVVKEFAIASFQAADGDPERDQIAVSVPWTASFSCRSSRLPRR